MQGARHRQRGQCLGGAALVREIVQRPVRPQRQGMAQLLGCRLRPEADHHQLARDPGFAQPHPLLHRDFTERVDAHLHVGELHIGAIALDPDLDVVINDPFDSDQQLHGGHTSYRLSESILHSQNLSTILLRGRDQGSCAARHPHVCLYAPVPALLFTLLTTSRHRS
ncbi:hypothetical protein D3C85_1145500 [compost metagenome]